MPSCDHANCGCHHGAACCLDCPLAVCVHDRNGYEVQAERQQIKNRETLALKQSGMRTEDIARRQGIAVGSVYDRLRRVEA